MYQFEHPRTTIQVVKNAHHHNGFQQSEAHLLVCGIVCSMAQLDRKKRIGWPKLLRICLPKNTTGSTFKKTITIVSRKLPHLCPKKILTSTQRISQNKQVSTASCLVEYPCNFRHFFAILASLAPYICGKGPALPCGTCQCDYCVKQSLWKMPATNSMLAKASRCCLCTEEPPIASLTTARSLQCNAV